MAYDTAITMYAADHGLPPGDNWFDALLEAGLIEPFQRRDDPWGRPYVYKRLGDTYDLRTLGPDGEYGTADDQTKENNWKWTSCSRAFPAWLHCG